MFSLVGFDCKGQIIPPALLPSPIDHENVWEQPHAIRPGSSPTPAPDNQPLRHCPSVTESSLLKARDTGTRRRTHRSRGRVRSAQVATVGSQVCRRPGSSSLLCSRKGPTCSFWPAQHSPKGRPTLQTLLYTQRSREPLGPHLHNQLAQQKQGQTKGELFLVEIYLFI